MRHHDCTMDLGVGYKPSIRYPGKLVYCFGLKLLIALDPVHNCRIGCSDW